VKYRIGLSLLAAVSALGQTPNPQGFTAAEVHEEGLVAHLRDSVVMRVMSAVIYAEDASFDGHEYTIAVRGNARVSILNVRAQPDGDFAPTEPRPIGDPRRLRANEIRRDGEVWRLHGKVEMQMPGMNIYAEDADLDASTATIKIRGIRALSL
jgi:hypothetical protein